MTIPTPDQSRPCTCDANVESVQTCQRHGEPRPRVAINDTFTYAGRLFRLETERDDDAGPPWEAGDGHGEVTEWTTRKKYPHEWILSEDRGSFRYYDHAASRQKARREQWGLPPEEAAGKTPKQIIEAAVRKDYEWMRAWCNDEWEWIGAKVALLDPHSQLPVDWASLWHLESTDRDYIEESVVWELVDELLATREAAEAPATPTAPALATWLVTHGYALEPHDGQFRVRDTQDPDGLCLTGPDLDALITEAYDVATAGAGEEPSGRAR